MTPKQFIEKAIEGGYDCYLESGVGHGLSDMFLDPKSWEAVGKVEGWEKFDWDVNEEVCPECEHHFDTNENNPEWRWQDNMHRMIDALCEGGSIESFLETL